MKKKSIWIFKSTEQMIVSIILFVLFIVGFIFIGTMDFSKKEVNDNEKFASEYKDVIDKDNVYTYVNSQDAYVEIKKDDVLILFGIKNSEWVGYYANILNSVAKDNNIDKIYYYDITEDRDNKNATYQSIVNYLSDYITHLDDGTINLYGPTFFAKKAGKVIYFDDSNAFISGNISASDYWNEYQTNLQKLTLNTVLNDYVRG